MTKKEIDLQKMLKELEKEMKALKKANKKKTIMIKELKKATAK